MESLIKNNYWLLNQLSRLIEFKIIWLGTGEGFAKFYPYPFDVPLKLCLS